MNDSEWMNVIHSVMHPFNHFKLFCSRYAGLGIGQRSEVSGKAI